MEFGGLFAGKAGQQGQLFEVAAAGLAVEDLYAGPLGGGGVEGVFDDVFDGIQPEIA